MMDTTPCLPNELGTHRKLVVFIYKPVFNSYASSNNYETFVNVLINEYKEKKSLFLKINLNALGHLNVKEFLTNLLSSLMEAG